MAAIDIEELRSALSKKSDVELLNILASDLAADIATVIQINIELRVRLHECKYHGRENESGLEKLLDDTKEKLYGLLKELSLNGMML